MKSKKIFGHISLLLCAAIWGIAFPFCKDALNSMGTWWVLTVRFVLAAVMFAFIAGKKLKTLDKKAVAASILMGLFLVGAYFTQTLGLNYTTSGKSAFLTTTYCVMTPYLAYLIYKRKASKKNIIAAVICTVGIGFITLESGFGNINIGDIYTIVCGVFFALQIVVMENYIAKYDGFALTWVQIATCAVVYTLCAVLFEQPPVVSQLSTVCIFELLFLALIATGFTFVLETWGMRVTPSTHAAVLMSLESLFGALFSVVFYGEKLTVFTVIGFVLVFISVLLDEVNT